MTPVWLRLGSPLRWGVLLINVDACSASLGGIEKVVRRGSRAVGGRHIWVSLGLLDSQDVVLFGDGINCRDLCFLAFLRVPV